MTGEQLKEQVLDLAALRGWKRAHFRKARSNKGWRTPVQADGQGFPDLILVKPGRMIAAECKGQRESLTVEQVNWLQLLDTVPGITADVWRPAHWKRIERILAG